MTGVLERLGIPVPGELLPSETYNEKGIYENKAVNLFHNRLLEHLGARWDDPMPVSNSFLATAGGASLVAELSEIINAELLRSNEVFAVKDPRMCRFVPMWRIALERLGAEARAIIPLRHPIDVASSLHARDKFVRPKSFLLWLEHTLAAEVETRGLPRSFIPYDDLVQNWRGAVEQLEADLALTWPKERGRIEADVDEFLSKDLRHHRARAPVGNGTRLDALVDKAWDALMRLTTDGQDEGAFKALDGVREELTFASAVLSSYVAWEFHALNDALTNVDRVSFEKDTIEAQHQALEANWLREMQASKRREHALTLERDRQSTALGAATSELDALQNEADMLRVNIEARSATLEAMLSSTSWRLLEPVRRIGEHLPPSARTLLRRLLRAVWCAVTPWRMPARLRVMKAQALNIVSSTAVAERVIHPDAQTVARPRIGQPPLRVFSAASDAPRISMVTDSISAGSLFGGVATALIFTALLAQRTGRRFRIVTRTQAPEPANIAALFRAQGIAWTGNIEFAFADVNNDDSEIDVTKNEIFVTTSWWTTQSTRETIADDRIIYILQEDERMFYPFGDEALLCTEVLSDPKILKVINSHLLFRHLSSDGVITQDTPFFEPAFPSHIYFPQRSNTGKRRFFFYARPNNPRNLYRRGVTAIEKAIQQGILDPSEWDIFFVGKDLEPLEIAGSVRPILLQNLPWEDYATFVRSVDLALTLMYTPHPSYPPLDVAACGGVAVTNRFGPKVDLSAYSPAIICVDPDVDSLVVGLRQGVSLATNPLTLEDAAGSKILRDWNVAFRAVFQSLEKGSIGVP